MHPLITLTSVLHISLHISLNPTNLFVSEIEGTIAYTAFKLHVFFYNIQGFLTVVYEKFLGLCLNFSFTGCALALCFFTELPYGMKGVCVSA